jgi:hypothetical protein
MPSIEASLRNSSRICDRYLRPDQERALVDKIKLMDRFKALYFCEGNKRPTYLSLPP